MRDKLGAFEDDHGIDMLDGEVLFVKKLACMFEEEQAAGPLPLRIAVREVRADVTEAGSAKKRVTESMDKHIAIGMADRALVERNFNATDDEFAAFGETVKVIANPAANAHGLFCSDWR
jgi:hypothetical protein